MTFHKLFFIFSVGVLVALAAGQHAASQCVPTSVARGPCHLCVCTARGVYRCTPDKCVGEAVLAQQEQPEEVQEKQTSAAEDRECEPGKMYKEDCNTCWCGKNKKMVCTKMKCLDAEETEKLRLFKQGQRAKNGLRNVNKTLGAKVAPKLSLDGSKCVPGVLYRHEHYYCFCTDSKEPLCSAVVTDENLKTNELTTPEQVRPPISDDDFETLPSLKHMAAKCNAGKTYKVECNLCVCLANGNLLCDKQICLSPEDINLVEAARETGKPCISSSDLPSIECLDCTCVIDKVNCIAKKNCIRKAVLRRLYEGPKRLKLNLETENCIPLMVYKEDCNHCYCQKDGTLRCTKRGCLNYRQVEALTQMRLELKAKEEDKE